MKNTYAVYFSATGTTERCVDVIAEELCDGPAAQINLADNLTPDYPDFSRDDVVIVAAPVYGGRIPAQAAEALSKMAGNGATAVAAVVFGNRDYDDAMLELTDILAGSGFRIVGAGTFVGCHSIFPKVGSGRPDDKDCAQLREFAGACRKALSDADYPSLDIKGNRPYKPYGGVSIHPSAKTDDCIRCGKCAAKCPVQAINPSEPYRTDATRCISCGRCISVCTQKARRYSGVKYALISGLFRAFFSRRKSATWAAVTPSVTPSEPAFSKKGL